MEDEDSETPPDSPPGPDTVPFGPPRVINLVIGHLPEPEDPENEGHDASETNTEQSKKNDEGVANTNGTGTVSGDPVDATKTPDDGDDDEVKSYSGFRTVKVPPAFTVAQVLDRIQGSLPEWPSFVKALKSQRLISGRHSWRTGASISSVCAEVGCRTVLRYGMLEINIESGSFEVVRGADLGKLPLNSPAPLESRGQSHMSKDRPRALHKTTRDSRGRGIRGVERRIGGRGG